jgi:hypothetical protein
MAPGVGPISVAGSGPPTDSRICAGLVREPLVPVTVRVAEPNCGVALVVIVRVASLPGDTVEGDTDAVTPAGAPDTDKLTLPENPLPPTTNIVSVVVVEAPVITSPVMGWRVKLCGDTTVNGMVTACELLLGPFSRTE